MEDSATFPPAVFPSMDRISLADRLALGFPGVYWTLRWERRTEGVKIRSSHLTSLMSKRVRCGGCRQGLWAKQCGTRNSAFSLYAPLLMISGQYERICGRRKKKARSAINEIGPLHEAPLRPNVVIVLQCGRIRGSISESAATAVSIM